MGPPHSLPGILAEIVAKKRAAVRRRRRAVPRRVLEHRAAALPSPRSLADALTPCAPAHETAGVRLLAELKRASPVAGVLARTFDPIPRAPEYLAAGAAALSVLTDPHFQGSLEDLVAVRLAVDAPVLQKDFVLDPYQLWEARSIGADAVLLIVAVLDPAELADLFQSAKALGLGVLVEIHDEGELAIAADLGAGLIGVNNRDLRTFRSDLATTERLAPQAPAGTRLVSESGIATRADVVRVARAGAHAILVGEALSRSADPRAKIRELLGA